LKLGADGEFLLFPDAPRELSVKSESVLDGGTYSALVIVDFGGDHLVAGEEIMNISEEGAWIDSADQSK
jgi:hypothetical protein